MNRRGFFGLLAGATVLAAEDPERLLWAPGRKLISIPNVAGIPLKNSENNLVIAKMVNREFAQNYAVPNEKAGYRDFSSAISLILLDLIPGIYDETRVELSILQSLRHPLNQRSTYERNRRGINSIDRELVG